MLLHWQLAMRTQFGKRGLQRNERTHRRKIHKTNTDTSPRDHLYTNVENIRTAPTYHHSIFRNHEQLQSFMTVYSTMESFKTQ